MMWSVYILECANQYLYTGITNDFKRRFAQHMSGQGGKFTHAFKAKKLLYAESCSNKNEALKREAQIKSWPRKKKLALIQGDETLLKKP